MTELDAHLSGGDDPSVVGDSLQAMREIVGHAMRAAPSALARLAVRGDPHASSIVAALPEETEVDRTVLQLKRQVRRAIR